LKDNSKQGKNQMSEDFDRPKCRRCGNPLNVSYRNLSADGEIEIDVPCKVCRERRILQIRLVKPTPSEYTLREVAEVDINA
jgi:hypothetical protein